MLSNLKKLFKGEALYTESEVKKMLNRIKDFRAGAIDGKLDEFIDERFNELRQCK